MGGDHLEWIRSRVSLLLVVGQGPFEVSPTQALPGTRAFAGPSKLVSSVRRQIRCQSS